MEKARDEPTWLAVYARLLALLDSGALDSLKRAFGRWIYRSFIRKKRPGIRLPDIDDFQQVHVMLQQRVEQWNAEILERGRKEGHKEGRKEGLAQARRDMAAALLERTAWHPLIRPPATGWSTSTSARWRPWTRHSPAAPTWGHSTPFRRRSRWVRASPTRVKRWTPSCCAGCGTTGARRPCRGYVPAAMPRPWPRHCGR